MNQMAPGEGVVDSFESMFACFCHRVEKDGDTDALLVKRDGSFTALTWRNVASDAIHALGTLAAAGVRKGSFVAQLSENRYEWLLFDLAIQAIGAVHVPIHATLPVEQVATQIAVTEANVVVVSTGEQLDKVRQIIPRTRSIQTVISHDDFERGLDGVSNRRFDALGLESIEPDWSDFSDGPTSQDLATVLFTSGTTGKSRGVMLTHGNLVANANSTMHASGELSSDVKMCFLPLSHIYARTCDLYVWIVCGNQMAMAQKRETVLDDCAAVRPTWINGVPYFFDKVLQSIESSGGVSSEDQLRQAFGGRVRSCQCGGAPLPRRVFDSYWRGGVPIFPGYGLTEFSPVVSVSDPAHLHPDAVGRPINQTEIRIAADGEILARGPHVMSGYWRDAAGTAETIRDGWLHTGDLGRLDDRNLLHITGRKKELIVMATGKNVSPSSIERLLTEDSWIEQANLIGEGRNYLTALIVPANRQPVEQYQHRVDQRLAALAPHEQVRKIHLVDEPFSIENNLLTSKLSLRRHAIAKRYAAEIDEMYKQR